MGTSNAEMCLEGSPEKAREEHVIRARSGWQPVHFRELWYYRGVLYIMAWRDIKLRYRQTVLGGAWAVLQPLLAMLIFTVFFGRVGRFQSGDTPYAIFAYAGLLPWTFFSNAVTLSSNSLLGNQALVSKVYFPRLFIPLGAIGALLLDLLVGLGLAFVLLFYYHRPLYLTLLLLPFFMVAAVGASAGVGLVLAALNVRYRDVKYVVPFLVQMGMFVTPIIYPVNVAPAWTRPILALNPMTGVVLGFRYALLGEGMDWALTAGSLAVALVLFVGSVFLFRRMEVEFGDVI
ncbi:MAG: ABC transporter permease [Acidobacteriota bacterium]|nr:ABC transporter permease [Acidobacteriota bacterium]